MPFPLKYIVHSKTPNASAQRNSAIRGAVGRVILFVDDDVDFGDDFVARHLEALTATGAAGISGLVLRPGEKPCRQPRNGEGHPPIHYPGGPNYQKCELIAETHVICTANFSVERRALNEVRGFDEQLTGTLDDVDLGLRLVRQGFRIVHHPGPAVIHFQDPASGSRSAELGLSWDLANRFYFQFRHYWHSARLSLLVSTVWAYCRPSRDWLKPREIAARLRAVRRGYLLALDRVRQGPVLGGSAVGVADASERAVAVAS